MKKFTMKMTKPRASYAVPCHYSSTGIAYANTIEPIGACSCKKILLSSYQVETLKRIAKEKTIPIWDMRRLTRDILMDLRVVDVLPDDNMTLQLTEAGEAVVRRYS